MLEFFLKKKTKKTILSEIVFFKGQSHVNEPSHAKLYIFIQQPSRDAKGRRLISDRSDFQRIAGIPEQCTQEASLVPRLQEAPLIFFLFFPTESDRQSPRSAPMPRGACKIGHSRPVLLSSPCLLVRVTPVPQESIQTQQSESGLTAMNAKGLS